MARSDATLNSSIAGAATSLGGLAAVSHRRPGRAELAGLLGLALGVMVALSVGEMGLRNAAEHGTERVGPAFVVGWAAFAALRRAVPEPSPEGLAYLFGGGSEARAPVGSRTRARRKAVGTTGEVEGTGDSDKADRTRRLLRLGLLMAFTMTAHNLPEGVAVGAAALTAADSGLISGTRMALAIGLHNVPEGIVVAAPLFAATRSRLASVSVAAASGLAEPLGALLAVGVLRGAVVPVDIVVGAAGGLMAAVCALELWPEGRACGHPVRLGAGIVAGVAVAIVSDAMGG